MQRYSQFSEVVKLSQQKRRYSTLYYPNIPRTGNDVYIISKKSDRLDSLAYQYYGDSRLYWIIQRENSLPKGSFMIPPGRKIIIPGVNISSISSLIQQAQF